MVTNKFLLVFAFSFVLLADMPPVSTAINIAQPLSICTNSSSFFN